MRNTIPLVAVSLLFVEPVPAQVRLEAGLVAHYPFNGNSNDASGHGYHGVNHSAELTADRFGNPNSAYRFRPPQYMEFPGVPGPKQTSWVMWFRTESDYSLSDGKGMTVAGAGALAMGAGENANRLYAYIEAGYNNWIRLYSPASCNDGRWHMAALTYDKSAVRAYLDGAMFDSQAASGDIHYDRDGLWLSKHWQGAYGYFTGDLDDIRVYDRALNGEEIQALFIEGRTLPSGRRGDMNRDGRVDLFDLLLARDIACGAVPDADSTRIFAGDLDLDHAVTSGDIDRFRDIVLRKAVPPPTVFGIQPSAASPGDRMAVEGWGFIAHPDSNAVRIRGIEADIVTADTTRLTVTVPGIASSGDLIVHSGGQPSNAVSCVINRSADAPVITTVEPLSAMRGQEVVITGSRFGASPGGGRIVIGDVSAAGGDILSWTDQEIRMRVPADAFPGNLYVVAGDQPSNGVDFHVVVAWSAMPKESDIAYTADGAAYVKNEILLDFRNDTPLPVIETFLADHDLTLTGLAYDTRKVQARTADNVDPFQLAGELRGEPPLQWALPSLLLDVQDAVSESWPPMFGGKYNAAEATMDLAFLSQWQHHYAMRTLEGHRLAERILGPHFREDVRVAILDTGLGDEASDNGTAPPDFASRIVLSTQPVASGQGVMGGSLTHVRDKSSHGTGVAGCAAGDGHVCLGTGKHVNIRPISICDNAYNLINILSVCVATIIAAEDPHVKVINMSLGKDTSGLIHFILKQFGLSQAQIMRDEFDLAEQRKKLVVISAGNESTSTASCSPTCFAPDIPRAPDAPSVIAVAGTQTGQGLIEETYSSSNFGHNVSVAAPAVYDNSLLKNDYSLRSGNGTSFAAPLVSGLAAEMFLIDTVMRRTHQHDRPLKSANGIIDLIQGTADFMGDRVGDRAWNPFTGYGRINVWKAVLSLVNGGLSNAVEDPAWIGFDIRASLNVPSLSLRNRIFSFYKGAGIFIDNRQLRDGDAPLIPDKNLTLYKRVLLEKSDGANPRLNIPMPYGVGRESDLMCSFSLSKDEMTGDQGRIPRLQVRPTMDDLAQPPFFEMALIPDRMRLNWSYDDYVYSVHIPVMDIVSIQGVGQPVTMDEYGTSYPLACAGGGLLEIRKSGSFKDESLGVDFRSENGRLPADPIDRDDETIFMTVPPDAVTGRITVHRLSGQDTLYSFSSMQELVIPRVVSVNAPDTEPGSTVEIAVHAPHFNERYRSYNTQIQFPEQSPIRPDRITPVTGQLFTHVLYTKIPEGLKPGPIKVILTVDNGQKVVFGDKGIAARSEYNYVGVKMDFQSRYKVVTAGVTTREKTAAYGYSLGCPVRLVDGAYRGEKDTTSGQEGWKETVKTTAMLTIDPVTQKITELSVTFHKTYQSTPGLFRSVTLHMTGVRAARGTFDAYDQYTERGDDVSDSVTEFLEKWGTDSDYNEYRGIVRDPLNEIRIRLQTDD
ncbi:S8 family serine peptidase [bacterium]|nr:S8 family serine peptidase [bacterium]